MFYRSKVNKKILSTDKKLEISAVSSYVVAVKESNT